MTFEVATVFVSSDPENSKKPKWHIFTRDSIYMYNAIARPSVRLIHGWIIQKRLKIGL